MLLEFLSENYVGECLPEHLDVEPETAVAQVVEVVFQAAQHLVHRVGIAVLEGGIGGDAGTYLIQVVIARVLLHYLVYEELALGAVSYEGHVSLEHVP